MVNTAKTIALQKLLAILKALYKEEKISLDLLFEILKILTLITE